MAVVLFASGCLRPLPQAVDVGRHRVRFLVPPGWEHLDHGRQQLFRQDEAQISLVDRGPATREAMVRELEAAWRLWREGRRDDALERMHELHGLELQVAPPGQRAEFWKPWTDATYSPQATGDAAVEAAFDALIATARTFPEVAPERRLEYVLALDPQASRREIAKQEQQSIHRSDWTVIHTWDRVGHMSPSRVAFVVNDGNLLVLTLDRGWFERSGPAFAALLSSIELAPQRPPGA